MFQRSANHSKKKSPKIISINHQNALESAVQVLNEGNLVIIPTETVYGITGNAFDDRAIQKVFRAKERSENLPLSVFVNLEMLEEIAVIPDVAQKLIKAMLPGPITLILFQKGKLSSLLNRSKPNIVGFRVPKFPFLLELIAKVRYPLTATSANKSGLTPCIDALEAMQNLALTDKDLVIDGGSLSPDRISTVVDLTGMNPIILREGAVTSDEIQKFFQE